MMAPARGICIHHQWQAIGNRYNPHHEAWQTTSGTTTTSIRLAWPATMLKNSPMYEYVVTLF